MVNKEMKRYKEWDELTAIQRTWVQGNFIINEPTKYKYELTLGGGVLCRNRKTIEKLEVFLNNQK